METFTVIIQNIEWTSMMRESICKALIAWLRKLHSTLSFIKQYSAWSLDKNLVYYMASDDTFLMTLSGMV